MTAPEQACTCCGFATATTPCAYCAGSVRSLDGRTAWSPRRERWHTLLAGVGEVRHALFAVLHAREFIGALRLPVAANVVAFGSLLAFTWLVCAPVASAAFASPWPVLDGVRASAGEHGAARWLLATWLLLGPPWIDLIAGALQEPVRAATERRMLGEPGVARPAATAALRLRDRARVAALVAIALPPCALLALVPWVGIAAVTAAGAAVAAVVWFEAPMARRGLPLRARLELLRAHRWRALGTGLGIQLASLVPFVNLLALAPIATVAATASYLQFPAKSAHTLRAAPRPARGA